MNGYPRVHVSIPFILETAPYGRSDKYTIKVIIHKTDNNEVPGFRGKNDEDRERNEDTLVTSLRLERQMYGELTDRLPGNTDEVTHSLSWDVSRSIRDTHINTWEGSQPRYRDVCLPEPFLDRHRINFCKT